MKIQEIRDTVYSSLAELLAGKGFRYVKKGEGQLIRRFKGGFQAISIPVYDYRPRFEISLLVKIRLDAVADMFNAFFEIHPKYRADSICAVADLRYFLGKDRMFSVSTMTDVSEAIRFLTPIVTEKIAPLLDRCMDIHSVDQLLNSGPPPRFAISDEFHDTDAALSLIVARMANNPDFETLVSKYENAISSYYEEARLRFARLVEHLRRYDSQSHHNETIGSQNGTGTFTLQ
jgi:hypothetical protein